MKIHLQNFLCYSDSTFDFGDQGIALLSGPSGVGKTSILRGIFFALFGEGNKLQAYGKTSCRVDLEFDGMQITRTKRPNRLVVNEVYEDDSAQAIINKKFGDTFKTSGYIQQNNLSSFILMSPIEKLDFLEKFAFRDVDLGKIKGRCKAHISKCHDELLAVVSQLEMSKGVLGEMDPPVKVKFPLKCKKSQIEKSIKNENILFKNCNTLIRRSEKKITATMNEINDLKILEATLQSRKETYDSLVEKLDDLGVNIDALFYGGDDELENYEHRLESVLAKRELYVMEDQLEKDQAKLTEMKETEEVALREVLDNIEDTLWKEYTRVELRSTISELKECLSDLEKIEQLKKEVARCNVDKEKHNAYKEELAQHTVKLEEKQRLVDKLTAQQELYSCPKCMSKLRLLNEELLLAEDVSGEELEADLDSIKSEIQSLKYNISKLQRIIPAEEDKMKRKTEADTEIAKILLVYEEIPKIDKIREDLEYLREYQASQVEIEKKKKELKLSIQNEQFSSSYQTFKRGIDKLERKIEKLREKSGDDNEILNEEELRQRIIEQKQMRDKIMELEDRKEKMEQERDRCKRILDKEKKKHIDKYGDIHNEDELASKVAEEEKNIEYQKRKGAIHERNLKQIEAWERYQENLEKYQTWVDKVDELDKKEKKARNEYAAATELKNKILESESIAMLNIIDSINTHARIYLDCFFTEHPISVNLQTFKQTKKSTKPNINISIEYKGMEADLNMLSGGELSRVILSYTLALAEMFNTPLLLLDECTSSLDQDLAGTVFDAIRENFNGKMTLIIAHQVVTGTFDKVLQLGRTE